MKKRFITLLIAIAMIATLLTGCNDKITETITSEKTTVGSYSLFQTEDVQEYLNFLETFDETKYEIVDISTSYDSPKRSYDSGEFYMVTYKKISE